MQPGTYLHRRCSLPVESGSTLVIPGFDILPHSLQLLVVHDPLNPPHSMSCILVFRLDVKIIQGHIAHITIL